MKITRTHLRRIIREELIREAISPTTAAREFEIMKSYLSKFCEWSGQVTSDMTTAEKALDTVVGGVQSIEAFQQKYGLSPPPESDGYSIEDLNRLIPTSVENLNILCRMVKDIENSLLSTIIDDLSFAGLEDIDAKSRRIIDHWISLAVGPALESLNMSDLQEKARHLEFRKEAGKGSFDLGLIIKSHALLFEGLSAILEAIYTLLANTQSYAEALRRVNPNIKIPLSEESYKGYHRIIKYTLKLAKLSRSLMSAFN
jgi:plasmid maintenance system antidote protein VapI